MQGVKQDSIAAGTSILIVVVRYQLPLTQAPVMRSLAAAFGVAPELRGQIATLVWDNSPSPQADGDGLPEIPILYRHSPQNVGVAGAYNRAMEMAEAAGCGWLLLLDQDTTLPAGFLQAMLAYAQRFAGGQEPAAVAPTIVVGETVVSPKVAVRYRGARDVSPGHQGLWWGEVVLVNTGLLLRVSALRAIGGFRPGVWLGVSGRYLWRMVGRRGMAVWLAGELRLAHHISLMAGDGISDERFANLLGAEDSFFALYRSPARNEVYRMRLLRSAWQERQRHPARARLLWRHFWRRLYLPRAVRVRAWRAEVAARGIPLDPW